MMDDSTEHALRECEHCEPRQLPRNEWPEQWRHDSDIVNVVQCMGCRALTPTIKAHRAV
jgi:hypothetical protein